MKIFRLIIVFVILILYPVHIIPQTASFNNITTDDGLSQLSVNSIYIDEYGMLWIATRSGLNLYDGKNTHTFKTEKDNKYSIDSNFILQVTGNGNGKIYILSTNGVSEYDMKLNQFKTLYTGKTSCIGYADGLYIASENSIYKYFPEANSFKKHFTLSSPTIKSINSILTDNKSNFWIGTDNGVYKHDTGTGTTSHIVKKGNITKLFLDTDNTIWAGSWEDGLFEIRNNDKVFQHRHSRTHNSVSSDFVRAISEDNMGYIWIGTYSGLDKLDKHTGQFEHYTSGDSEFTLTHSSVWCIEKDHQGTLWIGTYFGGVNYINPEYSIYTHYRIANVEGKGLSSPIIGRITEDDMGNLWIGTEGGGLNCLDRKTNKFKWYCHESNNKNSISHNNIKSLYYEKSINTLWIGTHTGGLDRLNIKTGKISHYKSIPADSTSLPSDIIRDLEPYTADSIIVATQNGLCIMNKDNGKCRQISNTLAGGKSLGMISDVATDKSGNLWIASTGDGIYVYNLLSGKLKNYRHTGDIKGNISSNNINNICIDSEGRVWLCTSGSGLDLYVQETDSFINFSSSNSSLSNDCIYQACESPASENLLLITTDGFSVFDKTEKEFRNYNSEKGFPLKAVNENALFIASNDEVFLGSIHSMVSFFEKDLRKPRQSYHIVPTRLLVNGKNVEAGDGQGILEKSILYTDTLILNHNQNMISLEYAVTNHIASNREKIIYRLEGFSDEWNDSRGKNEITYTNLHPGEYRLTIKANDTDSTICSPVELYIIIKSPFYKTGIAYLIYILGTLLIISYLIRTYTTRMRLADALRLEQIHLENIKKENEVQLKIFTDISHEFRTPLTLIISQIESAVQDTSLPRNVSRKLSMAYHSSIQLRELITELLDYRKHELGFLRLQVTKNDIVKFVKENYILFCDYASKKDISITFTSNEEEIELWFDRMNMQKVINNLLFNAIKHTNNGGKISISIEKKKKDVIISISDNGEGIPEKDLRRIFDIFYQSDTSRSLSQGITGSGIGLALVKSIVQMHAGDIQVKSKPNEGSTFTVIIPTGKEHFNPDDIISEYHEEPLALPVVPIQKDSDTGTAGETVTITPDKNISGDKPVMLIVEDNEQIREMLIDIMTPFYDIFAASSAEEALRCIDRYIPDIVITDVKMDGMDGKELCKKIKTSEATCHIPVVLLTAQTAVEQYIEGYQTGADDYITKPFNTQILVSRCNNLVNSRKLLQEKFSHTPETTIQMLATNKIDKDIMDRAITVIEQNIGNVEFNMNIFAREMGMARTNLFTKIKAITGMTPNDFIISIRLKKSAYLLKNNPELNITEIAEKVGFSSARYFSKCFKDLYHISPLSYRKGEHEKEE